MPPATRMPGTVEDEAGPGVGAPLAGVGDQPRPEQRGQHARHPLHVVGQGQLQRRQLRPGQLAGPHLGHGPQAGVAVDRVPDEDVGQLLADDRIVGHAHVPGQRPQPAGEVHPAADTAAADGHPLVHERGQRHRPAFVDVAEAQLVGHPHVGEEHLVERRAAGHLAQRPDLDARGLHVDEEHGEAAVAAVGVGGRPGDDLADVGVVGARRPHLLAVEDPLVAVAHRPRLDAGQVGAGRRLGEQLAGDDVAPVQRRQVPVPDVLDGVGQDRRRHHAEADAERADAGDVVVVLQALPDAVVGPGQAAAAVCLGAGDPAEPGVEHLGPPRFGQGQHAGVFLRGPLGQDADLVAALAPARR